MLRAVARLRVEKLVPADDATASVTTQDSALGGDSFDSFGGSTPAAGARLTAVLAVLGGMLAVLALGRAMAAASKAQWVDVPQYARVPSATLAQQQIAHVRAVGSYNAIGGYDATRSETLARAHTCGDRHCSVGGSTLAVNEQELMSPSRTPHASIMTQSEALC